MEFLQAYTFIINQKKGSNNKVVDSLSRRLLNFQEVKLWSIGIKEFKDAVKEEDKPGAENKNSSTNNNNPTSN